MEMDKILVPVIAILVLAVAIEGGILISNSNNSTETQNNEYSAFIDSVNDLNEKGGKIYFANGNTNEITAGANLVSVNGSTVHISAHGGYKEEVCPISGIVYFLELDSTQFVFSE